MGIQRPNNASMGYPGPGFFAESYRAWVKTRIAGRKAKGSAPGAALSGVRVWIAHGHPRFRAHLRFGLQKLGFEVTDLPHGSALLDLLADAISLGPEGKLPDLIIADANLPGYRGIQVLADLREAGVRIPFVLLSDAPPRPAEQKVGELSQAMLLRLPIRWEVFLGAVRELLSGPVPEKGPGATKPEAKRRPPRRDTRPAPAPR